MKDERASIKIDAPRETIIIEKLDGRTIAEGSHLYCGMCGVTLGTMKTPLSFPFDSKVLIEHMQFRTFMHGTKFEGKEVRALVHASCEKIMFLNDTWHFTSMDNYKSLPFRDSIMSR